MQYIVILDADTEEYSLIVNLDHSIEKYDSYDQAKAFAEECKRSGACNHYSIFVLCSDEKNILIDSKGVFTDN